jgi:hypothetical protein
MATRMPLPLVLHQRIDTPLLMAICVTTFASLLSLQAHDDQNIPKLLKYHMPSIKFNQINRYRSFRWMRRFWFWPVTLRPTSHELNLSLRNASNGE